MADSDQNSQIVNDPNSPNEPLPPGDGDGGGNGHPPPVRITSIAPIAGNLAGGSDVTIDGFGFQPGAELFFGTTAATDVQVQSSTQVMAKAPAGTQTGTVPISIVNPDGSTAQLANGFTYFTGDPSNLAEVLGVEPPNIIEDSDTQVTIRGRNLIAAHENGLVAFRGPARAAISVSDFSSSRDEATGVETLACTVRVVANPPLAAAERMAIQVLASVRPESQTDGIAESSREMFVVLPRSMPVTLAYTKSVDPTRPNLVIVTGRNLEGCSLDLGANATIHAQRSEDEYVAVLVSYPSDQLAPQLAVRGDGGGEVARLEMSVTVADDKQAAATMKEGAQPGLAIEPGGDPGDGGGGDGIPGLTPVPGQQVVGPTAQSSTVVTLGGQVLDLFSFDWSSFAVSLFRITFRLRIANFIKVVAFFDGGGENLNSPVLAKVGHLMPLRGMGIMVALRVEIIVSIRLLIIVSWKHGFDFSPWGLGSDFGLGSLVIGFEIDIDLDINIFFMVALVLPNGSLKILALEDFDLNFHFQLDPDGHKFKFTKHKYEVRPRRIGPLLGLPFLCEDRFQLAEDNGQTSFTDASGGTLSYYFVRGPGQCCLRWNFDLDLIQISDDGSESTLQPPFDADFCLNALDSSNQNIPIVVSDQCPDGFPEQEQLKVADNDNLHALMRPVDAATGSFLPTSGELQDVTEAGYTPYFYLQDPKKEVLDPHILFTGVAVATQPGSNVICVQLGRDPVKVIDTGVEAPSFWPGAVTGFSILSFLARGLAPALLFKCTAEGEGQVEDSVGLPVKVKPLALPGTMTIELTLAYYDQNNLIEAKQGATLTMERNEPFEAQRQYVLAATVSANQVQFPQTIKITSKNPRVNNMLAGSGFGNPREAAHAADDFFEGELANASTSGSSLSFTVTDNMIGKLIVVGEQDPNKPHLTVKPRNKEDAGKFVPPGAAVTKNDRTLKIDFEAKVEGNSTAQAQLAQSSLTLTVSNDETFEEYLRVFQEVTDILDGTAPDRFFKGFDETFYNELKTRGATNTVLNEQGKKLWDHAWQTAGTLKDDRPLYWTRLRAIPALRAFAKRQTPAITGKTLDDLITQFEWPSRGLDPDGAVSFGNIAATDRKVIVTGFDPFQLPSQPKQSNPSGMLALILNNQKVDQVSPDTYAATAIFPVRYRDFDGELIEKAVTKVVTPQFALVRMLLTLSLNSSDCYDVERWACQARLTIVNDNEGKKPTNVVAGARTFYQSNLPYERVITSIDTTRRLAGPSRTSTPFVTDQSYKVSGASGDRSRDDRFSPAQMPPVVEGSFRPEPVDDGAVHEAAAYEKQFDQPSGPSLEGSGGSYLSNEIFYRSARERDNGARKTLASGHLHLPFVSPQSSWDRDAMISGVKEALRKMLNNVLALRTAAGAADLPITPVTRISQLTLSVKNDSPASVKLTTAEVPAPFAVAIAGAVPQQVNAEGSVSLNVSFSPKAVGEFRGEILLKDGLNIIGSITLVGRATAAPPAPVISGFSPDSGPVGTTLTIDGVNLDPATRVAIAGIAITKLTNTDTQITATVIGGLRTGPVSVTTSSGTATTTDTFTVTSIRHPPDDLATQLVARRQELELNPDEAAAQIGAKPATYRRWEQGKDKPSARFHAAIVTFLGHDPDRDPREFGEQIKAARERDGLTRAQLAQRLNVSPSTVKAWEAGTVSRPSPRVAEIFENYLQEE